MLRNRVIAAGWLFCLAACADSGALAPKTAQAPTMASPAVSYYVDFRARLSTEDIPGHTYLAYGPQDGSGRPLEEHITGFYPVAGPVGILIGTIAFPGEVGDGFVQNYMPLLDSFRLNITAAQYDRLVRFVAEQKARPQLYSLLAHNCNDWAAEAAGAMGLNVPPFRALPPNLFVMELRAANS